MGSYFQLVVRYKYICIISIIIITGLSLYELQNLQIDTSLERLSPRNSKERVILDNAIDEFGADQMAIIYIQDVDLFTPKKLTLLQEFTWKLDYIPELDAIHSVFTTPFIFNEDDTVNIMPLFGDIPHSGEKINQKISTLLDSDPYRKVIINPKDNSMLISIQLKHGLRPLGKVSKEIDDLLIPIKGEFSTIYQVGTPSLLNYIHQNIISSFIFIFPLVILAISGLIYYGTKSINAAVLPFIISLISLTWTYAILSLLNIPVQVLTSCVPALAFVLGSTEITHLLSKYRKFVNDGLSHHDALTLMGDKIGLAIILTAITTTLGFFSITVNEIVMLREFGIAAAIALIANFLLMMFYLPIHLDIFKEKKKVQRENDLLEKVKERFLETFDILLTNRYLYLVLGLLIVFCAFYSQKITIENFSWSQIKNSSQFKKDLYRVSKSFPGTSMMYYIVEAKDGDFRTFKNLNYLNKIQNELSTYPELDHVQSLATQVEIIHREFNKGSIVLDPIPRDDNLIMQYLISFTRSDLRPFISADYKRAVIQIRHSNYNTPSFTKLTEKLELFTKDKINHEDYIAYQTSIDLVMTKARSGLIKSQISSISIIIFIIIIAMTLLFRDIKIALIAVPSNLIPICLFFGILGFFNIPLDTGSAMVAAVTVGIAIDDTIHFFVQYSYNININNNPVEAARMTIRDSSNAIIITSIALSAGFIITAFSEFVPLYHFGTLSAIVIIIAMFCDLIVTPTLITVFKLSNIVSFENIFLTQIPIEKIIQHPLFKGLGIKSLKKIIHQTGFSHKNKKEGIELDNEKQFIIIIKGHLVQTAKAQRSTDDKDFITIDEYKTGDIIEVKENNITSFHTEDYTRYILIKNKTIERFLEADFLLKG